jgi:hypothetical protein
MGEDRPGRVITRPFGGLKLSTHAPSYPHQVDLDVQGHDAFDHFNAGFSLSEGSLRSRTIYVYCRQPNGSQRILSLPAAVRKKFQGEIKKALLAHRLELIQLEMEVLEQIEARLETKRQTLVNLGATPRPKEPEEPSALGTLLDI